MPKEKDIEWYKKKSDLLVRTISEFLLLERPGSKGVEDIDPNELEKMKILIDEVVEFYMQNDAKYSFHKAKAEFLRDILFKGPLQSLTTPDKMC